MDKALSIFLCLAVLFAVGQAVRPVIRNIRQLHNLPLKEDIALGTQVFTLDAFSPTGKSLYYTVEADNFDIGPRDGIMTLIFPLNYEKQKSLKIDVVVSDGIEVTSEGATINVIDVNDNNPVFKQDVYTAAIDETVQTDTLVVPEISVTDVDFTNDGIRVECNREQGVLNNETNVNVCDIFKLVKTDGSSRMWAGQMFTNKKLDFEKETAYQVPVTAFDGIQTTTKSVEITVTDIQDTPPSFTKAISVSLNEGVPKDKIVNDVKAKDGDFKNPRDIRYEIYRNSVNGSFRINSVTGDIITSREIDREELIFPYIRLYIRARELISINPDVLGDDALTTATASIQINVLDINDNLPTFDSQTYNVSIAENYPSNTAIDLDMYITDPDQGSSGSYSIQLTNYENIFDVNPKNGSGRTAAGVTVIDSTLIDYETMGVNKFYVLYVTATERDNTSRIATATVTVNILDINDNNPLFRQTNYVSQVREDAEEDVLVFNALQITDPDSGIMGRDGVVFSLLGSENERFKIDPNSGVVRVAYCGPPGPGKRPCIDYETKKKYLLTAVATDMNGAANGRRSTSQLEINVLDINDNSPRFSLQDHTSYINDGDSTPNPSITFAVTDRDTVGGPIKFRIPANDPNGALWQVAGTELRAIRTIRYDDTPGKLGKFVFPVEAYDDKYTATASCTIIVRETNNHSPIFDLAKYEETIDETAAGLTAVLTVKATDLDPPGTDAGTLDKYIILDGSQGKFIINGDTGVISTAADAVFNYDQQKLYMMVVDVSDKDVPRRRGKAEVNIHIRDTNNKDPYMEPRSHRADILENVKVNSFVIKINGLDPDSGNILEYEFTEPITALTPEGVQVVRQSYDFTTLFKIDRRTGQVRTNSNLDRDRASVVTYSVIVTDVAARPVQSGTGTLIINILEYNDQPPVFLPPWTLDVPRYTLNVREELPIGLYVRTLFARDEDDQIDKFALASPLEYFDVSESGVVTVNKRIDFEQIEQTRFEAVVYDTGNPKLSASATIIVNIININDISPVFGEKIYQAKIKENSPSDTAVVTVTATDGDKGDYGVVRYALLRAEQKFVIDSQTGNITVAPGAVLDREVTPLISIQVQAYDSPLDSSVRRYTTIPVYIELLDENDNDPAFTKAIYRATIIETIPPGRIVTQLTGTDLDVGYNANLTYTKVPNVGNDTLNFFDVNYLTAKITVTKNLLGKVGIYTFDVYATDEQGVGATKRRSSAQVIITVLRATNSPPMWVIPSRENMTLAVLEEQYKGMIVYQCKAIDHDDEEDGRLTYGFYEGTVFTDRTNEFRINPVTGVIQAMIRFDREQVDSYRLWLVARDSGEQYLEATRLLLVQVLDVNDHLPQFPLVNGRVVPKEFLARENSPFMKIGSVKATDADLDEYADIYYYIVAGNDDGVFEIGRISGIINLIKSVDREMKSEYDLVIMATNNVSDASVISRKKRSESPNVISVKIRIGDVNDEPPVFSQSNYYGCVNVDAKFEQSILTVEADDRDAEGSSAISYRFENSNDQFEVDSRTGVVSNKALMKNYHGRTFDMKVIAADDPDPKISLTTKTNVKVFVTDSRVNGAKLVVAQPATEVRLYSNQIRRVLTEQFGNELKYVCILGVKDHVITEGDTSQIWSDVYLSAAGQSGELHSSETLVNKLNSNRDTFGVLHVQYAEPAEKDSSIIDETPVLIVLILVVILVVLALIMIALACCCIYKSKDHRLKKHSIDHRHLVVAEVPPEVVESKVVEEPFHNYDNAVFIAEPETQREPDPEPEQVEPDAVAPIPYVAPIPAPYNTVGDFEDYRRDSDPVVSPDDVVVSPAPEPQVGYDDDIYVPDSPQPQDPVYSSINKSRPTSGNSQFLDERPDVEFQDSPRVSPAPSPPRSISPSPPPSLRYSPAREDSPIMRMRDPSPVRSDSPIRDSFIIEQSDVIRYH